jgi:hypothetical protein
MVAVLAFRPSLAMNAMTSGPRMTVNVFRMGMARGIGSNKCTFLAQVILQTEQSQPCQTVFNRQEQFGNALRRDDKDDHSRSELDAHVWCENSGVANRKAMTSYNQADIGHAQLTTSARLLISPQDLSLASILGGATLSQRGCCDLDGLSNEKTPKARIKATYAGNPR